MAKYLSWDLLFQKSYYATARDELAKNTNALKDLEDIGKICREVTGDVPFRYHDDNFGAVF